MKNKYEFDINRKNLWDEEDHEKDGKNLSYVEVFDKNGNLLTKDDLYCVQIELSKEAALGLGKELIRSAHQKDFNSNQHCHLTPIEQGRATQNMGICLTQNSIELIIAFKDLGSIAEEVEKSK